MNHHMILIQVVTKKRTSRFLFDTRTKWFVMVELMMGEEEEEGSRGCVLGPRLHEDMLGSVFRKRWGGS